MRVKSILILYYVEAIIVVVNMLPGKMQKKFGTMKGKMANLLNIKNGGELLLDINELEFPGANTTLKNMHKEMWNEYYDCLKKQYIKTDSKRNIHSLTLTAMEGTSAILHCTICISPLEMHTIESVEWFYNSPRNIEPLNILIDNTEHIIISHDNRDLTLFNVQKNQEGIYWCKMKATLSEPYYFYVVNDPEPIIMVHPDEAKNAQHSLPPIILESYGLKVYSSWTSWTLCSTCDTVGKRLKYGYCTISLLDFPKNMTNKVKLSHQVANLANNVLSIFQNKLPCRSWYTPKQIQNIPEIKNRYNEVMVSFCKVKCQRDIVFEVRDINGKLLESANNSAGIYSMLQGMPELQPSIARITRYELHDTDIKIKCPGNLNSDLPIVWKIGIKIFNPRKIDQQSQGRISVDAYQRIIIKKLLYADANIYSCWQRNELAGTVRLKVTSELNSELVKFDHRVLMCTSIPIVSIFLWVYWRAFHGRHRYTKR